MNKKIKDIIDNAEYVIITSGAGMSVESGIPDFRSKDGLWRLSDGSQKNYLEMANPVYFLDKIVDAWGFYGSRYNIYKKIRPHDGYTLLKDLVINKKDYFLITSNVDGHFQKAGFDNNKILEHYGSINYFQCSLCCTQNIWKEELSINTKTLSRTLDFPKCKFCDATSRPNIKMFEDYIWINSRNRYQEKLLEDFLNSVDNRKGVIIEIGAGVEDPAIRKKSESIAFRKKIPLIRINPLHQEHNLPIEIFSIKNTAIKGIEEILNISRGIFGGLR